MRRLYIGGLSHSVTQKDLKDRFGKFGEVEDVELRTRRDDEGEESSRHSLTHTLTAILRTITMFNYCIPCYVMFLLF